MAKEWRCKVCGKTEFIEEISGGTQNTTFNEEGDRISCIDQNLDIDYIYCRHCDNTGKHIHYIAEYREE